MLKSKIVTAAEKELAEELNRFRIDRIKTLIKKRIKLVMEINQINDEIQEVGGGKQDREFYIDA